MADTDNGYPNGNGNGILTRMGKFSWLITLFAVIGGPFGSYMLFRQEMLVATAQQQLQINQNATDISKIAKAQEEMVPKEVHQTRWDMQKEVDYWRDKYTESKFENLNSRVERLERK